MMWRKNKRYQRKMMRNLLSQTLKKPARKHRFGEGTRTVKRTAKSTQDWELNSDIFYLLNTVKIYTETTIGKITLEAVEKNCLLNSLEKINLLMNEDEKQAAPIVITVCGATWEDFQQQQRVRAIPKAAGIRFFLGADLDSDAYFYHTNAMPMDELPSDLFSDRHPISSKRMAKLCPLKFIELLEENNARFKKPPRLSAAHFTEPLSAHESQALCSMLEVNGKRQLSSV